jgi:hypothetical protein
MRKNISWTKKIALAVAAGAIMVAGSVSAMAASTCPHDVKDIKLWQDTKITVDATCAHAKYTVKYCGLCGEIQKVENGKAEQTIYETYSNALGGSVNKNGENVSLSIKYCKKCGEVVSVTSKGADGVNDHSYDTYYVLGTDIVNHSFVLDYVDGKYVMKVKDDAGTWKTASTDLTDDMKACGATYTTFNVCKTCGLVTATSTTNPDHEFELEDVKVATATEKGTATLKCKNCDDKVSTAGAITTYPTDCVAGNHKTADESKGKCVNCEVDTTKLTNDADATEPAEEPSEEPAETTETKVSSGTVVGGGIAAAGILTLITLIVKYLGSVLF